MLLAQLEARLGSNESPNRCTVLQSFDIEHLAGAEGILSERDENVLSHPNQQRGHYWAILSIRDGSMPLNMYV
jgi:hypothetical protein